MVKLVLSDRLNQFQRSVMGSKMLPMVSIPMQSAGITKHSGDLLRESRNNSGVEKNIKTGKDYATDDNTDDDLDAGIDIALTGGGYDGVLGRCDCLVKLVFDGIDEFLHV